MRRLAGVICAALFLLGTSARADLPPPDGTKRVAYSFVVPGTTVGPGRALFAYPCGTSNGAPFAEHVRIVENITISPGTRGGSCAMYSVATTAYDEWVKGYKPTRSMTDPGLEALVARAQKCTGGPTPTFQILTKDSRTSIGEKIQVPTCTDSECVLTSATPNASTNPAATPASTPSTKPKSGGCQAAPASGGGAWYLAAGSALTAALVTRWKRRRQVS